MAITNISRIGSGAIVFLLALCPALPQAPPRIGGPAMGFVLDKTQGVRPILGIPGAATLGRPVLPATGLASIVLSPQRDYALALTTGELRVAILRNLSASLAAALLDVPPGASRVVLSSSGDAAALYYADARRVEVLTGLPDSPSVAWRLDLPDLGAGLAALVVSDSGSAVLAATTGEPSSILLLAPDVGYRPLQQVAGSPSMAFLANSLDAVVGDGASSQVFVVRDVKGAAEITQLGGQAEGVSHPVAVAAAAGNRRVLVANSDPGGVVSLGFAGEEPLAIPCSCTPTSLERLAGGAAFRLSDVDQGLVWLLDGKSSPPRAVFVPSQPRQMRTPILSVPAPVRRGVTR
jgi:hypothetical protein